MRLCKVVAHLASVAWGGLECARLVCVWEIATGRQSFVFHAVERASDGHIAELTIAVLDATKRCSCY